MSYPSGSYYLYPGQHPYPGPMGTMYQHPQMPPHPLYYAPYPHHTPIDPQLLIDPRVPPQTAAEPSPTASYADDDDNGADEARFGTLHPVAFPSPQPPTSLVKSEPDEGSGALAGRDDTKTGELQDPGEDAAARRSRARRNAREPKAAPVPPPQAQLSDDQGVVSKHQSPVKTLPHIDLDYFPSRAVFENILYTYQSNLSARKRNKALISRAAYTEIQLTLVEIREARCRRGTAQYRFWVKKMFSLINFHGEDIVGHQGKPVAIREDIYDILVHCHDQCEHGGRDRTVDVVKEFYRWIPKVIIGEFVKHCPGCSMKRATVKSESSKMSLYGLAGMESMDDEDAEWDDEEKAIRNAASINKASQVGFDLHSQASHPEQPLAIHVTNVEDSVMDEDD